MSDQDNVDKDRRIIHKMLKKSIPLGLELEVVYSFAEIIRSGERDFNYAATHALREWDIPL